jgi:serine phosphatase RsbU (regulator of sigma subunit)
MIGMVVLGVIALVAWLGGAAIRERRRAAEARRGQEIEDVMTGFIERSVELGGFGDVIGEAARALEKAFGAKQVVLFEPGAKIGSWDACVVGAQAVQSLPDQQRNVFGWLRFNPDVIYEGELDDARLAAMRGPIGELLQARTIDVLVPLVERMSVIGALGFAIGRRPTVTERQLLATFRTEATAAAANVRLHSEAAHQLSLEREIDLASAVQLALVPAAEEGEAGAIQFVGHFDPAGQTGSDFWSAYPLEDDQVLVVIGDVVGVGLAGSIVSAIVKSCCDTLAASSPAAKDPTAVLACLNRALLRPQKPVYMTCFAAIFDAKKGEVRYANAGHPVPYHRAGGELRVLRGTGVRLGDVPDPRWTLHSQKMAPGDLFLLYTDGLIETMNEERTPFGDRRLQRALLGAKDATPREAIEKLLTAVDEFRGAAPPADDEALVAVKWKVEKSS